MWTITVHKENELALSSGVGTTHRLDFRGIQTLSSPSNASQKGQVRNFLFRNFIEDPMSFKHFEAYLGRTNPELCNHLHFWEQIQRFEKSMTESARLAEYIVDMYVVDSGEKVM